MVYTSKVKKIKNLKARFKKLNPEADIKEVDFESSVDKKGSLYESLQDIQGEYPQFKWDKEAKPKSNDYEYLKNARADLEQSGYKTLKKAEYRKIIRMIKAKKPQPPQAKPAPPAVKAPLNKMRGKVVFVKEHTRKFPRQTRL